MILEYYYIDAPRSSLHTPHPSCAYRLFQSHPAKLIGLSCTARQHYHSMK